ncbi:hypothetical protein BDN70DRAFT_885768 [Pholiota conissans]|uniref:Uncharacterized protein n=1 Tax=Pholiota conissans TaxID=109636 RepID=A0A9P5YPE6_9AGAR|nr:hypothetical protein BDN70DRAFT_885768 [Pholiota conissans]
MSLPDLPGELLDEIAEFFYDPNSTDPSTSSSEPNDIYRALVSTCKALRAHFQPRVFSVVHLAMPMRVCHLADLIEDNPLLASYIRVIRLDVDLKCEGMFEFPPLLAILRAVDTFSPPVEIHLHFSTARVESLNTNTSHPCTHIGDAPTSFLRFVTRIYDHLLSDIFFPIAVLERCSNLRELDARNMLFVVSKASGIVPEGDRVSHLLRPKLDVLDVSHCDPTVLRILSEEIFDLSVVKRVSVTNIDMGTETDPDSKVAMTRRLLDTCARSVEVLHIDADFASSSALGTFYDLSLLPNLRECHFLIRTVASANPVLQLSNLLRTLPPLPEHNLQHLQLTFRFKDRFSALPDTDDSAQSHLILYLDAWSKFDDALVWILASGTRPFKVTLLFSARPAAGFDRSLLNTLFINWKKRYLPRSSGKRNLEIVFKQFIW